MSWDDDDWESSANVNLNVLPQKEEAPEAEYSEEEEVVEDEEHAVESSKPKKEATGSKFKPQKKSKQQLQKEYEEKMKAEEEAAKKAKPMTEEERLAEKLRLQKLVEEADNQLTDELFGEDKELIAFDTDTVAAALQSIPLDNENHYKSFAAAISKRLELENKEVQTREFVKELLRSIAPALPYEDLVEIDGVLSVVKNTKVKAKLGKKKKKKGKTTLKMDKDMMDDMDDTAGIGAGYDEEYDFM